jgi:DNA helicase II / ATP-dependent DNA helicase PcrA
MKDEFQKAYEKLNTAQKAAVDAIDGPVMVIAGPGTGKTQILTLRIANILKRTDTRPENILALTFTESGAKAMRERLASLIGETAYGVAIHTFHSFADSLIGKYPDAYGVIIGGRPASDIERITLVESILNDTQFRALRPSGDPAFYVKPILGAIATLKQEYVTPDRFAESIAIQERTLGEIEQYHEKGAHKGKERGEYTEAKKHLERNRELLSVYRLYESALRAEKLYDFDDMITKTVEALLREEDMLRDLQEQYQYVLADEHQDVNGSQNKILELLVNFHEHPNVFVVGDEKQAIFRFQGASLDNFLYFENIFGETNSIALIENYRSSQSILDVAHELIRTEDPVLAPLRVPLHAAVEGESLIERATFVHESIENDFVVSEIEREIKEGREASEIAVIVRTNKEVEDFAALLRKKGIDAKASAEGDILEHPILIAIERLLSAITSPTNEGVLLELLHEPYLQIGVGDLARVLRSYDRAQPLPALIRDAGRLGDVGVENSEAILKVGTLIDEMRERMLTSAPHRLLEELLDRSGLIAHVLTVDPFEGVRVVRRIYDEVEGMVKRKEVKSLGDVVTRLQMHRSYGVALTAPFIPSGKAAVCVMTAHKSKGLEFESVYIPHMNDRVWGNKKNRELFKLPIVKHAVGEFDNAEDDERRLLYVAMTRAKRRLLLTLSDQNIDGKAQAASRFLTGGEGGPGRVRDTRAINEAFSPVADLVALKPTPVSTELILETLATRGFSPTAFNNYLKSPWEYFYRNVLRVPQVKTTELQFGSAVHRVLDGLLLRKIKEGQSFDVNDIRELLSIGLNREALTDEEFTRLHARGLEALMVYGEHLKENAQKSSRSEVKIEAEMATGLPHYPTLKLNGVLDRVDYADDRILRVVDYKTGKPKTRGYIEGTTADSTGDYKRQLTFYALLLSLQEDPLLHCKTGVISFVEPDTHGKVKEEVFSITDEEIDALKTELIGALEEILRGEALTRPCDPSVCHYCHLVPSWLTT